MLANEKECTPAKGTNDTDLLAIAAAIFDAAMIGMAIYMGAKAVELAQQEFDIAERYYDIAQHWLDVYNDVYKPTENKEVGEWEDLAEPLDDTSKHEYDMQRGRARVVAWLQWKGATQRAFRCTSKYCTGLRKEQLVTMAAAQSKAVAMADGLGWRNERAYLQAWSDNNFKKRLGILKHGRNMIAGAADYGRAAANIYGDMSKQSWEGVRNIGQFVGYFSNRNQTSYPQAFLGLGTGQYPEEPDYMSNFYLPDDDPRVQMRRALGETRSP